MKRFATTEVISSLLILLFTYTALSRLFSIDRFKAVLEQSPVISSGAGMLAWQLPLTALCVALLLFFPATQARKIQMPRWIFQANAQEKGLLLTVIAFDGLLAAYYDDKLIVHISCTAVATVVRAGEAENLCKRVGKHLSF